MNSRVYLTSGSSTWRSALAISDQSALRGSFGILDRHGDLQHAALLGLLGQRLGRRGEADHAIGHRGRCAEGAGQRQKFAAVHLARLGALGHFPDVIRNTIPVALVECHDELPLLAFCRLQFRIQSAMSKRIGIVTPNGNVQL